MSKNCDITKNQKRRNLKKKIQQPHKKKIKNRKKEATIEQMDKKRTSNKSPKIEKHD